MRIYQAVWDLASNLPGILTSSMASASNLLDLYLTHHSAPQDKETDPRQTLWVGWVGTALNSQFIPGSAIFPLQAAKATPPHRFQKPFCQNFPRFTREIVHWFGTIVNGSGACWSPGGPGPLGDAEITYGPAQVACPLQAFSSHSDSTCSWPWTSPLWPVWAVIIQSLE